jgi:hypothetical protein
VSRRHPFLAILSAAVTLALVSCTGQRPTLANDVATTTTTAAKGQAPTSTVAEPTKPTIGIFATEAAATPDRTLAIADQVSKRLVMLVRTEHPEWLEVYLPGAPSGSTGWVRRADVALSEHDYRIQILRAQHRIRVLKGDSMVMDEPVALGPDLPPSGMSYYVKELLRPPAKSPFGSYAYGLSGFPNALTSASATAGLVAIHGTTDPASVGTDVSRGCIGMRNEALARLVVDVGLPLGIPVEILP